MKAVVTTPRQEAKPVGGFGAGELTREQRETQATPQRF